MGCQSVDKDAEMFTHIYEARRCVYKSSGLLFLVCIAFAAAFLFLFTYLLLVLAVLHGRASTCSGALFDLERFHEVMT